MFDIPLVGGDVMRGWQHMQNFWKDESGAAAPEYAFIIAATAMALIAVRPQLNSKLQQIFSSIASGWL